MSQFLVLSHIDVQNANSIAGLTWGFPAMTHFLGFTHALSRKISNKYEGGCDTELVGCAVISHDFKQNIYLQDKGNTVRFSQRRFSYTFKPKKKNGKQLDPSIIEEGKMNLTVSLVVELSKPLSLTSDAIKEFENHIHELCSTMRLAGGTILNIKHIKLLSENTEEQQSKMLRQVKRLVMPGFVLLDKSEYLEEHYQSLLAEHEELNKQSKPQLIDAWLDFSALKYKAYPQLAEDQIEPDENTPAEWKYVPKPKSGYLVPLMTGYKAISELYEPEEVLNTRYDPNDKSTTKTRFVEAVHSVGEWKGAHSIKNITDVVWHYQHDGQWYLCRQKNNKGLATKSNDTLESKTQTLNLTEALNQF